MKEPSKQSSLPSAAEAERIRLEERERDRQERAKAFLERELRAKERAEEALRRLQREKQERMKALMEQREMRAKRMAHVHPKGEAGNMNEWQSKLAKYHAMHEERRKAQGMIFDNNNNVINNNNNMMNNNNNNMNNNNNNNNVKQGRPTPRAHAESNAGDYDNKNDPRKLSVLEQRNREARDRDANRERGQPSRQNNEDDKENLKQIMVPPSQNNQQHVSILHVCVCAYINATTDPDGGA